MYYKYEDNIYYKLPNYYKWYRGKSPITDP